MLGAVVGGLITSTLLDSLLTPLLFRRFGKPAVERLTRVQDPAAAGPARLDGYGPLTLGSTLDEVRAAWKAPLQGEVPDDYCHALRPEGAQAEDVILMIEGKRLVLVDDSIVRGTTSLKIVQMIRDAGAKEVHIRVASPMIFHPDFYGIDTPDAEKLLANQYLGIEAMAKYIGADSLAFLSIDGLYKAVGGKPRDPTNPQFTDHYFTGDYPTRLLDREIEEGGREDNTRQLSLLVSA